jgi:hypothetical protein
MAETVEDRFGHQNLVGRAPSSRSPPRQRSLSHPLSHPFHFDTFISFISFISRGRKTHNQSCWRGSALS